MSPMTASRPLALVLFTFLLLSSSLSAQANATSELMTYGDVIGQPASATLTGLTPNVPVLLIPSFQNTGSAFLVGQTGDPLDQLAVGVDLAAGGNRFSGISDAQGEWTFSFTIPNNPGMLDTTVYWQGWTEPGASGAARYDDFSNLRALSMNQADRWQGAEDVTPLASSNLSWVEWEEGAQGALSLFICGGGPALLTDTSTPYPTIDQAWKFDTASGKHELLPGTMAESRAFHNTVKLQDGRFMVMGGIQGPYGSGANHYTKVLRSAEIYDPVAGTWSAAANMSSYRAAATATVLPDGRVLIAGGTEGNNSHDVADVADLLGTALRTTEIYNPATNTWTSGPNMNEPKAGAMAVTLADGRWLVAGGITHISVFGIPIPDFSNGMQIYNPGTGAWSNATDMRSKRALGGITLLQNGKVYMAGGAGGDIFNIGPIRKTEIYNPTTDTNSAKADLTQDSAFNTIVTLPDGRALIVGGAKGDLDDPVPISTCWTYDNPNNILSVVASLPETHGGGVVHVLEDGTVYCGGGESNSGLATTAARIYTP